MSAILEVESLGQFLRMQDCFTNRNAESQHKIWACADFWLCKISQKFQENLFFPVSPPDLRKIYHNCTRTKVCFIRVKKTGLPQIFWGNPV